MGYDEEDFFGFAQWSRGKCCSGRERQRDEICGQGQQQEQEKNNSAIKNDH